MTRKKRTQNAKADRRIFNYWIEVKSVADGTVRVLPVKCFRCVPLVREGHPMHGRERIEIRVEDENRLFVGDVFDEIARQLQSQYPDGKFERFLKMKRDKEAEMKRDAALEQLAGIVARAALDRYLEEESKTGSRESL